MAPRSSRPYALMAAAVLALSCAAPALAGDFVRVNGLKFTTSGCSDFKPVGWNGYSTLSYAAGKKSTGGFSDGRAYLTNMFRSAQALNFNVYRFFVQGDYSFLTTWAGQYDEQMFVAFDWVLAEAAKYGIRVTPIFLNLWNEDGVPLFEKFCGSDASNIKPDPAIDVRTESVLNATERLQTPYQWYTTPACRRYVKDFITKIVNRKNTFNGLVYKDDPTIFSWNMLNEPRCKYCGPAAVTGWYNDIAAHLKSQDPNHLVTTGEEGFFDESSKYAAADPTDGNKWGPRSGQDFEANHASPDVDYAVIHMWPDNWGVQGQGIAFGRTWIQAHADAAAGLGKPLIVEEFGKAVSNMGEIAALRDPWYQLTYDAAAASVAAGGALRGALFWVWDGTNNNAGTGVAVTSSDSTVTNIVEPFARSVAGSCLPSAAASQGSSPASASPPPSSPSPAASIALYQAQVPSVASAAGRKLLAV